MIKRLRIHFICINMAIVTAMLLVIFGMVLHFTVEDLQRQSLRVMEIALQSYTPPMRPGEEQNKVFFPGFLVDLENTDIKKVQSDGYFDLSDEKFLQGLVDYAAASEKHTGVLREYNLRYLVHNTPTGKRIAFIDITTKLEIVKNLVKSCILIGILSEAAFLAISIILANWAVRPVENAWNQQRQFVADASHELKTPLTVIMTNAELLQSGRYSQEECDQFSRNIFTMSQQMRNLLESMLGLARVDSGTAKMNLVKLNFSELAEECLMGFEPVYFEKGRFLEGEIEENLQIRGNCDYLRQVVNVLLDNGSKYSDVGSVVCVKLKKQGSQCILSVASRGEAISPTDLKKIFKRFYRADKARSRDGSYGLGLAIAESIVSEHGGKIWAESDNGTNTFFVQLNLMY